ncbi:hypothetical protein ACWDWO_20135 [Actinopolymorpha singaporensis]
MNGIVGLVLVVAALVVLGVALIVVGRRRERRGSAGDLATPRDDGTTGNDLPRAGEDKGHAWFSGGWGGGAGGDGS